MTVGKLRRTAENTGLAPAEPQLVVVPGLLPPEIMQVLLRIGTTVRQSTMNVAAPGHCKDCDFPDASGINSLKCLALDRIRLTDQAGIRHKRLAASLGRCTKVTKT